MKRDLTQAQALAEAMRRWGKNAAVERTKCRLFTDGTKAGRCSAAAYGEHPKDCPGRRPLCKVGRIQLGMFFSMEGTGSTYQEAFAKVDRGVARDRAKYCRRRAHHNENGICGLCHYQGPAGREGWAEVVGKVTFAKGAPHE